MTAIRNEGAQRLVRERVRSARPRGQGELAVVNRQSQVDVDLRRVRGFLRRLLAALDLAGCALNVGFVDDGAIARLNARFRGRAKATDVLSFPWREQAESEFQIRDLRFEISDLKKSKPRNRGSRLQIPDSRHAQSRECDLRFEISDFRKAKAQEDGYLGDIVISAETARRNARAEGHSTENEIRWLILHGILHLCGFDHEQDDGEMTTLELRLRERLRI